MGTIMSIDVEDYRKSHNDVDYSSPFGMLNGIYCRECTDDPAELTIEHDGERIRVCGSCADWLGLQGATVVRA
jgi:hypothetical protein